MLSSFAAGYQLRPKLSSESLANAYARYLKGQPSHKYLQEEVIIPVMTTDYSELIDLHTPADVAAKRAAMAAYAFRGEADWKTRRPDTVERDALVPLLADLRVSSVDVLTVTMPWGIDSKIYFLHAAQPRSCLMIYQEGHQVSFLSHKHFLESMTDKGCDVLALSLPLTGAMNSRPLISHPRFGRIQLNEPDDLQLLDSATYSSLNYFFLPLRAALNHALEQRHYDRVGAAGFSGGGWAAQVYAALDPRIQATYSVAGSVPINVHAARPNWGSPEQRRGQFYEIVNYSELYVMDADRPGRRHVQIYNLTDPCCFSGDNWKAWVGPVRARIDHFGGSYAVLTYQTKGHTLTPPISQAVAADFLGIPAAIPETVAAH